MATARATYGGDPLSGPVDYVRFQVGDTDCATARLSDAEIRALLESEGSPTRAASRAAVAIASQFAAKFDIATGRVRKSLSQVFDHYLKLADRLMEEADASDAGFYAGGLSHAEKQADASDTDLVQPTFVGGAFGNPEAGGRPGGVTQESPRSPEPGTPD